MKSKKIDWCVFFASIEKDPTAITPTITLRQLYEAKDHVAGCDVCFLRTQRVMAKSPPVNLFRPGEN